MSLSQPHDDDCYGYRQTDYHIQAEQRYKEVLYHHVEYDTA